MRTLLFRRTLSARNSRISRHTVSSHVLSKVLIIITILVTQIKSKRKVIQDHTYPIFPPFVVFPISSCPNKTFYSNTPCNPMTSLRTNATSHIYLTKIFNSTSNAINNKFPRINRLITNFADIASAIIRRSLLISWDL
jgi:hypothetical protein